MKPLGVMKNSYLSIVAFLILVFSFTNIYSQQESPCASSSCTANDFNLINFYLGDENGDPFGDGSCDPGPPPEEVDAHIWVEFSSTASASRYSLYLYFDVKLTDANGGVTTSNESECLYLNQEIPHDGLLDIYTFMWDCGDEVELSNFYMSWQTSQGKPCGETSSHCYCEPGPIIINAPLIPNFTSQAECVVGESIEQITFSDATTGGLQPYTNYNWNFGSGATPATANTAGPHNVTYATTGDKTVILEITDSNGTTLTEEKIITIGGANCCVLDMSCPSSFTDNMTCAASLPDPAATTFDLEALGFVINNTCGTIIISNSDSTIPDCSGDVIRTYTILDDRNGNGIYDVGIDEQIICEQTITINDNINPTASNLNPINVECYADVPNPNINLITDEADNCTITPTVSWVSDISNNNTCPEVITRTYSVTDDCSNQILVTQTITVDDTIAPVLAAAPADVTVECIGDVPAMVNLGYTDNCDAAGTVTGSDSAIAGGNCGGTITRTWTITDSCGNVDTVTQTITVDDTIAPVLAAAPADVTVECIGDVPAMVDLGYTDNCDTAGTVTGSDSAIAGGNCGGTITRTWTYTDSCGNTDTVTQTITVDDTIAPVLAAAPADVTVECIGDVPAMVDLGYTDNCDAAGTVTGSDTAIAGGNCGGTITRTWTITDSCGNVDTVTQTITVDDTIAPVMAAAPADVTVECIGDVPAMVDLGYTDNCDAAGTVTGSDTAIAGGNCGGTITRTWTYTDSCGNVDTVTQTITVDDNTAPVVSSCSLDNSVLECLDSTSNETTANNWNANNIAIIEACATDNCDTDLTIISDYNYDNLNTVCGPCGTLSVNYTITDDCGNESYLNALLSFDDITIPDLSNCNVDNLALECDGANNETVANQWNLDNITALEACAQDLNITVSSNYNWNDFNVLCGLSGNLPVTYTVTDDCDNSAFLNVTITFTDTTAPIFNEQLPQDTTVECDNVPTAITLTADDSCDNNINVSFSEVITNQNDDCANNYTITRTWTVTDCAGNSTQHIQIITVEDNTAPTFDASSLPQDITLECSDNIPALEDVILTATDNCANVSDIVITPSEVITNQNDDCSNNYTITRTWIANDCAGNSIQHVQVITVEDNTAPAFDASSLPQDITFECSDNIPALEDVILTATDNCSDVSDIIITPSEIITNQNDDCSNNYTITRTWVANDCAGNSIQHVQVITVEDNTAPAFDASSLPQNITFECSDNIPALEDVILTATDNCSDVSDIVITPSEIITNQNDECSNNYTITRTWIANDCAGNTIEHVQVITVQDSSAPVLSALPADATVECDSIPDADIVTATDNCDTTLDVDFNEQIVADPNGCATNYTINRTWTVTDCAGNITAHTQVITVEDNSVPVLSGDIPDDVTVECDAIPEAAVLTVADNCGNNIPISFTEVLTGNDDECANNYTITRTWTVTDCAGNSTQHIQIITVEDNTAPTFDDSSLPQDITLECSDNIPALEDVILTATDNCADVSDIIITPTEIITNQDDDCSNNYIITRTWTANDCAGNSIQHIQVITVEDNTAPVFDVSSLPQNVTLECSDNIPALVDVILTATDNCSDVSDIIITPSEIITNQNDECSNNYTITRTWIANDCAGNSVEHVQVITVEDNTAPVFDISSLPQDVALECSDNIPAIEDVILTATDNCSDVSDIIITPSEIITNQNDDCSNNYTITRTWIANDCAGNSVEHVQVITVEDNTAPTFDASSLPLDVTLECSDNIPALEDVILTATDNCSDMSDIIITPSEEITNQDSGCSNNYTITRTWVANDCAGNSIEHVQVVTIVDTTQPLLSEGDDGSAECTGTDPSLNEEYIIWRDDFANITATDNCGEATLSVSEGQWVEDGCSYTMTINIIATDECGLVSEIQERTFVISDTTAPEVLTYLDDIVFYCNEVPPVPELDIEENCSDEATVVFTETTIGTEGSEDYQIIRTWTISDDCENKTIKEQILLVQPDCDCLEDKFISKAITPNGDIYNDYFKVEGIDDCGTPSLKIFNRWGALVYQSDVYDSKKGRWRGTAQGGVTIGGNNNLPTGTYYYIIEIRNRDIKPITGHVYLSTK